MAYKRIPDEIFLEGTIKTVAEIGIENLRTKLIADRSGYTEATMYQRFSSKEAILRESFLYVDKRISTLLTESAFIRKPDSTPFDLAIYAIWRKVYRYLIEHKDETLFLIRYRYSSYYTNEVRNMRQAYNGAFNRVYAVFEKHYGKTANNCRDFLLNYVFEMMLGIAEKVITGMIEDDRDTEYRSWTAVSSALKAWAGQQGGLIFYDKQGIAAAGQA